MKLSLFTPTHRPTHLMEVYNSIREQKGDVPFEWIIVPNGGISIKDIPAQIRLDNRVKVKPVDLQGIGALKRFACSNCVGDVLVELDHDDLLTTDAFEELAKAHTENPTGFYYSDFVNVKTDGKCETYGAKFGWRSYKCEIDGSQYTACRSFEPSARSMAQIYYAPNHIRAWSRDAYRLSGGHNDKLPVADDHDLICKTYIAGTPFVLIPKPLYIYRRHAGNSFVEYNKTIQELQNANMHKYLYDLVEAECQRNNSPMLDIGRASRCRKGWEPDDMIANGYCFNKNREANSVGCIRAFDFWQRVPQERIIRLMNECYRVLAPGGWLLTATPSIDDGEGRPGRGVFQDPTHKSYWSANNFWYFSDKRFASLIQPEYQGRFQEVRLWTGYPSDWHRKNFIPYVHADLCALKGQRQPGECKI